MRNNEQANRKLWHPIRMGNNLKNRGWRKVVSRTFVCREARCKGEGGKSESITQPQMACQRGINLFLRAGERRRVGVDIGANLAHGAGRSKGSENKRRGNSLQAR